MPRYLIKATSFAAPVVGDYSEALIEAADPKAALEVFAAGYDHTEGLYSANCYERDGRTVLARWLSNHALALASRRGKAFRYYGHAPGRFELNGEIVTVEEPKVGFVY